MNDLLCLLVFKIIRFGQESVWFLFTFLLNDPPAPQKHNPKLDLDVGTFTFHSNLSLSYFISISLTLYLVDFSSHIKLAFMALCCFYYKSQKYQNTNVNTTRSYINLAFMLFFNYKSKIPQNLNLNNNVNIALLLLTF